MFFILFNQQKIPGLFGITEITPEGSPYIVELSGMDVDKPLKDFADDFNEYLDYYNQNNRWNNLMASIGYFVAALTSLFSAKLKN